MVPFVGEIQNLNQLEAGGGEHAHPLTPLGPPQVMFSELRILNNGVIVEHIQDFGRTAVTLNSLTPYRDKDHGRNGCIPDGRPAWHRT